MRRWFKATWTQVTADAFKAGMTAGFLLMVLAFLMVGPDFLTRYRMKISVVGGDVSHRGGTEVTISDVAGNLVQTCVDGCDDVVLRLRDASPERGPGVSVRDRAGREILSFPELYVGEVMASDYEVDEPAFVRKAEQAASAPPN